jgi:hypothetical protein
VTIDILASREDGEDLLAETKFIMVARYAVWVLCVCSLFRLQTSAVLQLYCLLFSQCDCCNPS